MSELTPFDPHQPGRRRVRRSNNARAKPRVHEHGWARATDLPTPSLRTSEPRRGRRAPTGTSFLLAITVSVIAAIGIVRVHASTEILELGGRISELTEEQAQLLEQKRRLAAERAYLRQPEQIEDVARKLGLVPITPELVQPIRLMDERNSARPTGEGTP